MIELQHNEYYECIMVRAEELKGYDYTNGEELLLQYRELKETKKLKGVQWFYDLGKNAVIQPRQVKVKR